MKILISACLVGQNVKYDGTNNSILEDPLIKKLLNLDILIPICPETEGGLATPREPVEIKNNKAIEKNGNDKTENFFYGADKACQLAIENGVKLAIMKTKSPSCGSDKIYDGNFNKTLVCGDGITVKALKKLGIKAFSEDDLDELKRVLSEKVSKISK